MGGGVARKIAKRFPDAEEACIEQVIKIPQRDRLGRVIFSEASEDLTIASLIGQEGFGPSLFPRIRYSALQACLEQVADHVASIGASVQMPKIGTGSAGDDWSTIDELLNDDMVLAGLFVTVYDVTPKRVQLDLLQRAIGSAKIRIVLLSGPICSGKPALVRLLKAKHGAKIIKTRELIFKKASKPRLSVKPSHSWPNSPRVSAGPPGANRTKRVQTPSRPDDGHRRPVHHGGTVPSPGKTPHNATALSRLLLGLVVMATQTPSPSSLVASQEEGKMQLYW